MNKDQFKDRIKQFERNTKEVTSEVIVNKSIEVKGKVQESVGKVQPSLGDLKNDLK